MNFMRKALFVLLLAGIFLPGRSQKFEGFTSDTANYPVDVALLFGNNVSSEDEYFLSEFKKTWASDFFSDSEKGQLMAVSKILFDRKARGIPHFKIMLNLALSLKKDENLNNSFSTLFTFLNDYFSKRKTTLGAMNDFMQNLYDLVTGNLLYNTAAVQWQYSGEGFSFDIYKDNFRVKVKKGQLKCLSKRDSISINDTQGYYDPIEESWKGSGGIVTWERAGFSSTEVYAKLNNYAIELKKSEYQADSVIFTYAKYFKSPVMGVLEDKVMRVLNPEQATYPVFVTYNKRYVFQNLYENIDYDGGFTMKGAKIIGSGDAENDAIIDVKNKKKILMEVRSKYFVFRPDRINGLNSQVKIFLGTDSIFHSDLNFLYYVKNGEVNLLRTDDFSSKSPYYDSYHKVNMDFEQLTWRINQPKVQLTMARASSIGKADFESESFFNQLQFESLQGMDESNPLVLLSSFSRIVKSKTYTAKDFADYVGRPLNQVRQLVMWIAQKGFIYYNSESDVILLKDRLFEYLKASTGSIDFDVVDFVSSVRAPMDNAVLDMDNYDILINGIPRIAVSDSQNVIIYPARDQIILKENRSFQFDGKIQAGLFTFYGSNFFFDYPNFKINLQNVDSVTVNVRTGELDNFGLPVLHKVQSVIQHLTGDLRIDKPDNKSGRKSNPEYPLFTSRENSYVYYQDPKIESGAYPEESFYFELYPFVIDSLDNFSKEGMEFKGKFVSAGILPDIEQTLVLQPDYSLGFKYNPGPNGIPVYSAKGTLKGDIQLSNNGLRAKGELDYLTSTTHSNDFKFYPDSMNTQSLDFTIAQQTTGTEFPQTASADNYIHWDTRENQMHIKNGSAPFNMFNPQTTLAGNLVLQPSGLAGEGKMDLTTADITSNEFHYKSQIIDADSSQFNLKSLNKTGYTVLAENMNAHIDFAKRTGDFASNEDFTLVQFPENKYISYLDYFKWDMDAKTLEMGAKGAKPKGAKSAERDSIDARLGFSEEPVGPRYISVHKQQDSLNFVAPLATYDYKNNQINASDVKLLRVADAIIYTLDGKVTVNEGAQMKTLYKTKIVAGYENRYYTLYDADVNIKGRYDFTGEGKYDYVDETEKVETIDMKEIKVDTGRHTIATGVIVEPDNFTLSPYFAFQGKITLNSTKPLANFDGGVKIIADCPKFSTAWLKFSTDIDPKNILIPVPDEPVNINFAKIYNGVFIASDSIHIYPAFLSGRRTYSDAFISTSSGFLRYNKDSSVFEIASMDKLNNRDSVGNYLSFHKFNCIEYGEGQLDLGVNLGQVKLKSLGNITFNLINRQVDLNLMLGIDFMFDPGTLKLMANKIDSFPNLTGLDITRPQYVKLMNHQLGRTKADKYREDMTLFGAPKEFPAELQHTLNITSLHLRWNDESNSYQSVGKIGVGNILDNQVNKMVDGFVEITKKRSGDLMDIYLKLDDKNYYYFGYTRGVMQAYSSNNDFIGLLRGLPLRQRQMDVPRGQTPYIFMVSSDTRIRNFLRNYMHYSQGEAREELPEEPIQIDTLQNNNPPAVQNEENVKPGENTQKPPVSQEKTQEKKPEKPNENPAKKPTETQPAQEDENIQEVH